jgi:hypothetical protein
LKFKYHLTVSIMLEEDQFFVTLLSSSCIREFPNNKTSKFSNTLFNILDLNSDYKVALSEISFPDRNYIKNVTVNNNRIIFSYSVSSDNKEVNFIEPFTISIPTDHYISVDELVARINFDFRKICKIDKLFDYSSRTKEVSFFKFFKEKVQALSLNKSNSDLRRGLSTIFSSLKFTKTSELSENEVHKFEIKIENKLALMLGFKPNVNIFDRSGSSSYPNIELGFPNEMFVYSEICEPQFVGNLSSPVLRMIPTTAKTNGEFSSHRKFKNEYFLALSKYRFQTIDIELKDGYGNPFPFKNEGGFNTKLVLHFQKYNRNSI